MIVIQDVLISDEILKEFFACQLQSCKGACCIEGDYGAPLSPLEKNEITQNKVSITPYLTEESKHFLAQAPGFEYREKENLWVTSCHEDGACVFMYKNELGIAFCGIEKSFRDGLSTFKKPISCHLYPIRVTKNEIAGFEAWNYDRWDICAAGCQHGHDEKIPLYQFLREAIIRYKGEAFYEELAAAADHINKADI